MLSNEKVFDEETLLQGSPDATYLNFIAAIARRDVEGIAPLMTEEFGSRMCEMLMAERSGPALRLWCEQFPSTAKVESREVGHNTATLQICGLVAGERIGASVVLKRMVNGWCIDREHYHRQTMFPS